MTDSTIFLRTMRAIIFSVLVVASAAFGDDHFTKRFAYSQVMAKCFGEKAYYDFLATVVRAAKECYAEPMQMHKMKHEVQEQMVSKLADLLKGDQPVILPLIIPQGGIEGLSKRLPFQIPFDFLSKRQKRSALYDAPFLKALLTKAMTKVSNYTCALKKLDIVDDEMNLNIEAMKDHIEDTISKEILKADLLKSIDFCNQFSMCLPNDESPMPQELKRVMAFMKCDKKIRMSICMKQDILNYMNEFDVSELPFDIEEEGPLAEKILHILWGSEAKDEFEIY